MQKSKFCVWYLSLGCIIVNYTNIDQKSLSKTWFDQNWEYCTYFCFGRKYKGFSEFIKGKNFRHFFHFFIFVKNLLAKIGFMGVIAEVQKKNRCNSLNFGQIMFFNFLIFKRFFSQHWIAGCDCWGPDGRLDTKIDQIDKCHIYMSYASYDIKCHIMTNVAYDIEIWHWAIWSILVSKRPSGPQQLHLFIRFWLINSLQI